MSRLLRFAAVVVALAVLSGPGCKKNSAPEPPQIQGPGIAKPGATLTFGFTSTDPDGNDVWYMVSWGDGTPTEWSSGRPSGGQYVQTHVYPDSGTYFIKARAKDLDQSESDWSDSIQVAVGYFAPNTPFRPSGPTACTTGVAYTYKARSIHPLGDNVSLQFYWGDTLGDWGFLVPSGAFFEATHVFETLGTYMIAVRAKDERGLQTAWSDSLRVVVDTTHGNPGGAPQNVALSAATDSTVNVTWTAPSGMTPNKYVVSFKRTGYVTFETIGEATGTSLVHDPAGKTGQYKVTAVYDSAQYSAGETPGTTPVSTSILRIPELNQGNLAGYGWNRATGAVTLYDMTLPDSASRVDLYVTDFALGYAGPDYSVANPFFAPSDPGGGVPAGAWHIVEFTPIDTLLTENDPLPRYVQSRYGDNSMLAPLPALISCYTEDGYYALMKTTAIDTVNGTADVQTWFQLVRDLRLIEH